MTAKEIQTIIFEETGLKTSVKKGTGSMKGYVTIWPIYQNESYPTIPIETVNNLKEKLSEFDYANKPLFCSTSQIDVYGISDERNQYKKESKPQTKENTKSKTWGSKNSQIRLDKASKRYAKRLQKGDCARYY